MLKLNSNNIIYKSINSILYKNGDLFDIISNSTEYHSINNNMYSLANIKEDTNFIHKLINPIYYNIK